KNVIRAKKYLSYWPESSRRSLSCRQIFDGIRDYLINGPFEAERGNELAERLIAFVLEQINSRGVINDEEKSMLTEKREVLCDLVNVICERFKAARQGGRQLTGAALDLNHIAKSLIRLLFPEKSVAQRDILAAALKRNWSTFNGILKKAGFDELADVYSALHSEKEEPSLDKLREFALGLTGEEIADEKEQPPVQELSLLERFKRVIPHLSFGLVNLNHKTGEEDKFIIAIDDDLARGNKDIQEAIQRMEKVLASLAETKPELKPYIDRVVFKHGSGSKKDAEAKSRLAEILDTCKGNGVKVDNMIIIGREDNLTGLGEEYNDATITAINDDELLERSKADGVNYYYPFVDIVVFSIGRSLRYSRDEMINLYKLISNKEELEDEIIWDMAKTNNYRGKIVIILTPKADKLTTDAVLQRELERLVREMA
ncbi:MAG: hypothetical protein PVH45_04660, partial [Candidatus Omnitrophota bacterium]